MTFATESAQVLAVVCAAGRLRFDVVDRVRERRDPLAETQATERLFPFDDISDALPGCAVASLGGGATTLMAFPTNRLLVLDAVR
jgi:hypothetical protein